MDDYNLMYEDDVVYDELKRQILLLTADDDEDCFFQQRHRNSVSNTMKSLQRSKVITTQPAGRYFSCWDGQSQNNSSAPSWLVSLWRNGNGGTGVFIPHIVKSRRRQTSGKKNNGMRRMYKQVQYRQS